MPTFVDPFLSRRTLAVAAAGLPPRPPPSAAAGAGSPPLARGVTDPEAVERVPRVTLARLRAWGEVVAYTPVSALEGLRQPIEHRWRHEGREMGRVRLPTPVRGGRAAGFRTFSRKVDFPADAQGRWTVDVLTATGQLIGRLRFTVDP